MDSKPQITVNIPAKIGYRNEFHLVKLGPPFACKGYSGIKLAEHRPGSVFRIDMGDRVRKRKEVDAAFAADLDSRSRGSLVPDETITPMAISAYNEGKDQGFNFFDWDGFGRTPVQIQTMIDHGFLTRDQSRTVCVVMIASLTTCERRLSAEISTGRRSGRDDNGVLAYRYLIFRDNLVPILNVLRMAGISTTFINADDEPCRIAQKVVNIADNLCRPLSIPTFTGSGLAEQLVG